MLDETILIALNAQMGHEFDNSYVYKSFAGIADFQSLLGTCSWFHKQAEEEYKHFDKFFNYICDKGSIPALPGTSAIPPQIIDIVELFNQTVAIEHKTLDNLKLLAQLCKELNDDQTYELVLWYLKEQVSEIKEVEDIQKRVLMSLNNILIIDQELGKRI